MFYGICLVPWEKKIEKKIVFDFQNIEVKRLIRKMIFFFIVILIIYNSRIYNIILT